MPRRDTSNMDRQLTLAGQIGTSFPWDLLVTERCSDTDTAESMGRNIAKLFTKFGASHPEYFRVPPNFDFQKDVTSDPPKPLNYFMCDVQCFLLLQQVYSEDNSKEDVMRDDGIMTKYFGSPEHGRKFLQNITEGVWRG